VVLFLSHDVSERDVYAIGSWSPLWFWVNTAPQAFYLYRLLYRILFFGNQDFV